MTARDIEDVLEPILRRNAISLFDYAPELSTEWCYRLNRGFGSEDFSRASHVKAWWNCSACHREYKAQICNRSLLHSGCPYCTSKKVCSENALSTRNRRISREWHPTKNGALTPRDVTSASAKKVWWLCSGCARGFKAIIDNRTRINSGCPYCTSKQTCRDNSLSTCFRTIAREWHPTKNGKLKPSTITAKSGRKVWWICARKHAWEASVANRTSRKSGCPRCYKMHAKK